MMKRIKPVILIFLAVFAASARIDFTGSSSGREKYGERSSRSIQYPTVSWFPGKSFCNCGAGGNITSIDITKCESPPCSFYTGDDLTLQFEYVTETYFAKLDLNISLIDQQTGQTILLRHLRGSAPVEPCETKSTFTILSINNTIPTGKSWYFEILRTYAGREICARFPVYVINNSPELNTTKAGAFIFEEKSERGTLARPKSEMFHFSPFEEFTCPGEGTFADPTNCTKYHNCQYFPNGTLWDIVRDCPLYTVWCQEKQWCDYPTLCPCELPHC